MLRRRRCRIPGGGPVARSAVFAARGDVLRRSGTRHSRALRAAASRREPGWAFSCFDSIKRNAWATTLFRCGGAARRCPAGAVRLSPTPTTSPRILSAGGLARCYRSGPGRVTIMWRARAKTRSADAQSNFSAIASAPSAGALREAPDARRRERHCWIDLARRARQRLPSMATRWRFAGGGVAMVGESMTAEAGSMVRSSSTIWKNSRSQRILWMLEELGLPL